MAFGLAYLNGGVWISSNAISAVRKKRMAGNAAPVNIASSREKFDNDAEYLRGSVDRFPSLRPISADVFHDNFWISLYSLLVMVDGLYGT